MKKVFLIKVDKHGTLETGKIIKLSEHYLNSKGEVKDSPFEFPSENLAALTIERFSDKFAPLLYFFIVPAISNNHKTLRSKEST